MLVGTVEHNIETFDERELELVETAPNYTWLFETGDRVVLRSGSPPMTVFAVDRGNACCIVDMTDEVIEFPLICLDPYTH